MNKNPQWLVHLPNALTLLRLLLVPFLIWLLILFPDMSQPGMWWTFIVFTVAALTDKLDGDIARKYGLVSNFGKLFDPISDKALVLPALFLLVWQMSRHLPAAVVWLSLICVILIALREIGISVWRMILVKHGKVVPASSGGKTKTATHMAFIGFSLVPWNTFFPDGVVLGIRYILVVLLILGTYLALISAKNYVLPRR